MTQAFPRVNAIVHEIRFPARGSARLNAIERLQETSLLWTLPKPQVRKSWFNCPEGQRAVSGSLDKTLKLWNLAPGEEIASFTAEAGFTACALAPDGVTVVAGDTSGRVHFLRLEGL